MYVCLQQVPPRAIFWDEFLDIATIRPQIDVYEVKETPCARSPAVPSRKLRNKEIYTKLGNVKGEMRPQAANLIPFRPKKKKKVVVRRSAAQLRQLVGTVDHTRHECVDEDWLPISKPKTQLKSSTATVATQTLKSSFFSCKQIPHNSMRELQLD